MSALRSLTVTAPIGIAVGCTTLTFFLFLAALER